MSEKTFTGEEFLKRIRSVRGVLQSVSELLLAVQQSLDGWAPTGGAATEPHSASIDSPEQWMPHSAFRYLKSDKEGDDKPAPFPNHLVFCVAVLDSSEAKFKEPIFGLGVMEFKSSAPTPDGKTFDWAARIAKNTRLQSIESAALSKPKVESLGLDAHIEGLLSKVQSLTVPLISINGEAQVKKLIDLVKAALQEAAKL